MKSGISQPGSKADGLNQSTQELSQVRQQYQELLELGMQSDNNGSTTEIPDTISGQFCRNSNDIEIQQWSQVWTRLVSMITQYVPFPSVQSDTGADKRAILVDLVSKLCDKVGSPEENEKYIQLQKKYTKAKKSLHRLHVQCETLLEAVHKNAKDLERHVKESEGIEKDSIAKKLDELTEILNAQLRQEKYIIQESRQRKGHLKESLTKMQKSRNFLSSDSDDQLEIDERNKSNTKHYSRVTKDEIANSKLSKSSIKTRTKSKIACDEPDIIPQEKLRKRKPTRSQLFGESSDEEYLVRIQKRRRHNSEDELPKNSRVVFSESSSDDEPFSPQKSIQKSHKSVQKSTKMSKILSQLSSSTTSEDDIQTIISTTSSSEEDVQHKSKSFSKPKAASKSKIQSRSKVCFPIESDSDIIDDERHFSKSASRKVRTSRHDNLTGSPKRALYGIRERCGRHVNELVEVANGLREDYKRIRRVFSDDTSSEEKRPSISKISYINDSVVKPHSRFNANDC